MSFLIERDDLAALKLLKKTHRGRIQMIYYRYDLAEFDTKPRKN